MKLGSAHALERTIPVAFLLGLFSVTLIILPGAALVTAAPMLVSTDSSANCENNDSLFSFSFSCSLNTTAGSAIIVFFGCLSGPPASCNHPSVTDSQSNVYRLLTNVETSCSDTTCEEYAFSATASSTGSDTVAFSTAGSAFLGADVYDVSGINATAFTEGFGGSSANYAPYIFTALTPYANGFVAAGVIANSAYQFVAGPGYTIIPGQPCYYCGMIGGWQASEYGFWGQNGTTIVPFNYQTTNDGWAELALAFAPNVDTISVTCTPSPVTVTEASECTAAMTGAAPTGTVTWTANATGSFSSTSCALSSGACSVSYTPSVPSSSVTVTANYGGDSNNPGITGSFSLSVMKATSTTVVTCSPSPVTTGSLTTCSASISGVSPAGVVTWASSGVANFSPATTCTLSAGSCAVNYTPSSASPVTITGLYSGDADNDGSTGMFSLSVAQATTTSTTSSTTTSTTSSSSTTTSASTTTSSSATSTTTSSTKLSTTSSSTTPTLATTSSATTKSTVTTSTSTTVQGSTTTAQTSTTSTSSPSGGGVPVFPYQFAIASVFTALLVASYLLVRRKKAIQIN
jgi:hypothetical protein